MLKVQKTCPPVFLEAEVKGKGMGFLKVSSMGHLPQNPESSAES